MTLSFDPNTISLPVGHFIGGRLVPAEAVIDMHRPSDGKAMRAARSPTRRSWTKPSRRQGGR